MEEKYNGEVSSTIDYKYTNYKVNIYWEKHDENLWRGEVVNSGFSDFLKQSLNSHQIFFVKS